MGGRSMKDVGGCLLEDDYVMFRAKNKLTLFAGCGVIVDLGGPCRKRRPCARRARPPRQVGQAACSVGSARFARPASFGATENDVSFFDDSEIG